MLRIWKLVEAYPRFDFVLSPFPFHSFCPFFLCCGDLLCSHEGSFLHSFTCIGSTITEGESHQRGASQSPPLTAPIASRPIMPLLRYWRRKRERGEARWVITRWQADRWTPLKEGMKLLEIPSFPWSWISPPPYSHSAVFESITRDIGII